MANRETFIHVESDAERLHRMRQERAERFASDLRLLDGLVETDEEVDKVDTDKLRMQIRANLDQVYGENTD